MRALIPNIIFEEFEDLCASLSSCKKVDAPVKTTSFGVSVSEDGKNVYFEVPLPGIKAEEIQLFIEKEKRTLNVKAEQKQERSDELKYHVEAERNFFYRFPLSPSINMEAVIDAAIKDGILTITLQKNSGDAPIKIGVKAA